MTQTQRRALAGVFHGMEHSGPSISQALRAPRLQEELQKVQQALNLDRDDLRQLDPRWVASSLETKEAESQRSLAATAIFLGTAQACLKGCYISESAQKVECGHLVRPISCVHPPTSMPSLSTMKASGQKQHLFCERCDPLDVALQLARLPQCRRVAVLRCTPLEAPRSRQRTYNHIYEDQIFLRTTYFEAFERLARDLSIPPDEAIKQGSVVYTSGVGILRGPLKHGAPWVDRPPQVDIAWFGLPAHPQIGEQEIYAQQADRDAVIAALDRAFAWASSHGADAVVLPPMCGIAGFRHPRLHFGGLVHEVARLHERHIPVVCVASENPVHQKAEWWEPFEDAVGHLARRWLMLAVCLLVQVIQGRPIPPVSPACYFCCFAAVDKKC
ncbi:unnamed protein product [Symbiodinium pilosum]|uniref:Macro domain-containing protein n=1 Tax=Symbiodinium pilosum TaxID=2952 RepID=A0A812K1X3_SYMPI|nr:unnamed protein product [Symbiodinium pilosum]